MVNGIITVVANIELNSSPTGVAYDPVNNEVYVTENSGTVAVINPTSEHVVDTVQVGSQPTAITVETENGEVFVAAEASGHETSATAQTAQNPVSNEVYLINGNNNQVVTEVAVGSDNVASITYDSASNEVVAEPNTNTVATIDVSTNIVSDVTTTSDSIASVTYDSGTNSVVAVSSSSDSVETLSVATTSDSGTSSVSVSLSSNGGSSSASFSSSSNSGATSVSVTSSPSSTTTPSVGGIGLIVLINLAISDIQ